MFPARLRVLEENKSWREGRLHPIALSAERMVSPAVAADTDGGAEDGINADGVEVHYSGLWQVELLQLPTGSNIYIPMLYTAIM